MRFLDLYISGFGKFHDTAVSCEDGLNVIYGKNEAGSDSGTLCRMLFIQSVLRVCVDSNLEFARCVNGHGLADAARRKAAYQTMSERQQASER